MGVRRLRRLFVPLAVVALLVTAVGPVTAADSGGDLASAKTVAKGKYDSYIVVMKADPLVATEGRDLDTKSAKSRGQELRQSHTAALRDAGVATSRKTSDFVNVLNGFAARVSYTEALKLAGAKGVAYVLPDELLQPQTDESGDFLGLTGSGEAYDAGLTGKGVVVGIIDTGIWPEHPSFADNGLPEPPTGALPCEFGNTAHNPNDAPFACNNKLIGARQVLPTYRALIGAEDHEFDSARDDNGHGTHTASTAAGNADVAASILGQPVGDGTISGIAPDAHVIAYKGLGELGGFSSDLALAIDTAVADGVDVINYSIGGGATAITADELAFLFAADAGVHVANSAGNTGPGEATIRSPSKVPWLTTVGANTQDRFFRGSIRLGNGKYYYGASVTQATTGGRLPLVDAADAGGDLCISGTLDPAKVSGAIVLCRRGENARVDKSLAVQMAGGLGMILYENDNVGNLFTDTHWVPTVHVDNAPGLKIKEYIAKAGASAKAEIRDTKRLSKWQSAPSMTVFSSRGPNVFGDIIKPDITAPGMQILAGASPFVDPGRVAGELFQSIAGTSMSSPHVAGLYALLDQAHPDWSPAATRSALMTTADIRVRDNDRRTRATPFEMGAGMADPGRVGRRGSAFQPGLVYDAGFNDYLGFACDAFPALFTNPAATCAALEAAGIPTDASDLNYPSISVAELAGSQTVTRTVTSVSNENRLQRYKVSVSAPAGYSISVSPSVIRLRPGESATYEVTILNESGPIGEWRFGSLTWRSTDPDGYDVRSPIAVKGAAFDTVSKVEGSGESGSASFDVKFGYTGEYSATPHGLVAATLTADNVDQDPNQTFALTDVAAGGANAHVIAVNAADVLRIAIPPEAAEAGSDLDVYLYNPSGQQVASSTAGDTDELIEIVDPADGNWTAYVHGWLAPGGSSDYTMFSWVVPDATGGTLVVDSAPSEAVIGTTGTVQLSWTGATAGQWHYGSVTHTGDGGVVLGRTMVEVDNR